MSQIDHRVKIATYILEELALRGGISRLRYLKTFRLLCFWLGKDIANYILNKLAEGKYITLDKDRVILNVKLKVEKNYNRLIKEFEEYVKNLYINNVKISLR